ncbi:hypothetical protein OAD50_01180 [Vicingaceae bacterium]|nr:hypothetical protein [Vicingaceae bacterium]MDB4061066.1 hypothetical protein [Vicingaceae bacterium]MDB9963676.1 hypothetical protein [Vicingaceae bacterium]MDC1451871.1 hypothetical protein [Vicingaceae bacterium]
MQTKEILHTFYTAFSKGDAAVMIACYHQDLVFEDLAFGKLTSKKAKTIKIIYNHVDIIALKYKN